ncbi:hypothetical protein FQA39_LY00435 [Lamprigera yunnana]|nr:hypothetical protein FQA39_LY00435 [Lamprigera yunnana]
MLGFHVYHSVTTKQRNFRSKFVKDAPGEPGITMDGKKKLSGAEYRKRAKEKDNKQNDVIKKTRKLDDFFGKVTTDTKDHAIKPRHDVPCGSGATSTDVFSVSSSLGTLIVVASVTKEEVKEVPGMQLNSDQRLCEISDDSTKLTIDEFTLDYICKKGANQNIKNDFPKSGRIYKVKNYLLTTMTEQRLNDLALRNIEADYLRKLDCEDLINDFAALKYRCVLYFV